MSAEGALYGGSLIGLNELWYKNYSRSSFHFFNDNPEWKQMDKAGHVVTGYTLSLLSSDIYRWTHMDSRESAYWGSLTGFGYLTIIEILDGFSAGWGASSGDIAANILGTGIFLGQELAWQQQRIQIKWSFHSTDYAKKRPEALGSNLPERMLKDYNGQTMWLSANPSGFIDTGSLPEWLNIAFGYSADGMLGAHSNPEPWKNINQKRQYFFSLDVDWRKIPTQSKFLKFVFKTLSFVKIPFPALEYSGWEADFHLLYW